MPATACVRVGGHSRVRGSRGRLCSRWMLANEDGSVEMAVAARRRVFDPRQRILVRRGLGWGLVALGVLTVGTSLALTFIGATSSPVFMLFVGAFATALGLGRVDLALAELRRYDQHVKPLPRARLRLRLPPP